MPPQQKPGLQPIKGLPEGSILTPVDQSLDTSSAPPVDTSKIQGLPKGALLTPVSSSQGQTGAPQAASYLGGGFFTRPAAATKEVLGDLGTGMAQGAANTVGSSIGGIAKLLRKIPYVGETLAPQAGINALEARTAERSQPQNTTQQIGKTGEQVGEFLLPSGLEEHLPALAARLPWMGKAALPLLRTGEQALEMGTRNASQGGSFGTGAVVGGAGGAIGEGLRAAAPAVAESALGITKQMRGYGKTPGVAALEETSGLRPATIERQAQAKIGQLTSGIENAAASHTGTVSLQPAIDTIDQEIAKATAQNNAGAIEQLQRVRDSLTKNVTNGLPLSPNQPATTALNLKRGVRTQFVKNWNPELMSGTRAVAAHAGGAIDSELDNALGPEFASANQRISSLVPVAERAESLGRDPSIAQKVGNRIAAHTGALAGSVVGGAEGYREHGLPGLALGSVIGLTAPEILAASPTRMAAARAMYSPATLLRLLTGAGLQLNRPSGEDQQ